MHAAWYYSIYCKSCVENKAEWMLGKARRVPSCMTAIISPGSRDPGLISLITRDRIFCMKPNTLFARCCVNSIIWKTIVWCVTQRQARTGEGLRLLKAPTPNEVDLRSTTWRSRRRCWWPKQHVLLELVLVLQYEVKKIPACDELFIKHLMSFRKK